MCGTLNVVSRIRKAYELRFRELLQAMGARRVDAGVGWLVNKAQALSLTKAIPLADALTRVHNELSKKFPRKRNFRPARFLCDAGLGGLARWMRAAGQEALWQPDIEDDQLLLRARDLGATVLTTDGMLMERRVVRDRVIPTFWLPPTLSIAQQLQIVFREFNLSVGESRCMSCSGQLRRVDKEVLKQRIPPRTYLWLDEYFVCNDCDKLFWRGTHWERIRYELDRLSASNVREP
jgi:uncharacterized protein